ncbi:hypothetical protein PybrP1_012224 [[Pythium] brassicae (nom. inval.)]|nr:hypothetical protein PybrP1_012224 [[Pythium] brassicae (nom. inval.)]
MLSPSSVAATAQEKMEAGPDQPEAQPSKNVSLSVGCPDFLSSFYAANTSSDPFLSFSLTKDSSYAFFSVHFAKLLIPLGTSVVLRAVEDFDTPDRVLNVTARLAHASLYSDFSTSWLRAKELRVEVYRDRVPPANGSALPNGSTATGADPCFGFVVDRYEYETIPSEPKLSPGSEETCAQDNSVEAICYWADYPTAYKASRAVARMLTSKSMGQSSACTGWLLGSSGHLLTNNHCVQDNLEAAQTTFEFMADAVECKSSCQKWGGCEGVTEALGARVVYTNAELDYTLLKLAPVDPSVDLAKKYGFLRLKDKPGHVGQQIYIPQHPLHQGKRIAMFDDYKLHISIMSTNATGCKSVGYAYTGDTQIGSSGSPVVDSEDHGVVALHRCGQYCANTGVPAFQILQDLQARGLLPANAVDSGRDNQKVGDRNADYFPDFTPQAPAPPLTLTQQLVLDGAIRASDDGKTVSVDQIEFSMENDGDVEVDVLSVEVSDSGNFTDVNGDCRTQYMDAVFFLFAKGSSKPLKIADDTDGVAGRDDGSVSYRDPYLRTFLKKGQPYVIALGSVPLRDVDAYNGVEIEQRKPELFACRDRGSNYGAYRVTIRSSTTLKFERLPDRVVIPQAPVCANPASARC